MLTSVAMGEILTILTTRWLPGQDHSYDLDHLKPDILAMLTTRQAPWN